VRRRNLTIATGAQATRILFDRGRAASVEYARNGRRIIARADREVLLSGGAYNSPHLLLLSGIGPADRLRAYGIPVVHDAKGVGANLQDHVHTGIGYATEKMRAFDVELRADKLFWNFLRWAMLADGPLCSLPVAALAYLRTRDGLTQPDIELLMNRINPDAHIWFPGVRKPKPGFMGARVIVLHPESRGTVTLRSTDPMQKPIIRHNFLSVPGDLETMRRGIRIARDIYRQRSLTELVADEVLPGRHVQSDSELDDYIRATAGLLYHPVGTCRMGNDADAVVDADLRVNGLAGLRVVDASVMPTVPGGHTNAPVIMIAEKAADAIRGRARLPRADI
jgi:choline dehydrogenase